MLCSLFWVCNFVFMGLSLLIVLWAESAVDLALLTPEPLPIVQDLIRDWEAVPFVAVDVQAGNCTEGTEEVFVRSWNGTERGCKVENDTGVFAEPRDTWKEKGNLLAECSEVKAVVAKPQGVVTGAGKRICGRRGGKPFESVVRPDVNGNCPEGTEACSTKTSAENTVCYARSDKEDSCPITHMMIVTAAEKEGIADDHTFVLISGNDTSNGTELYLAYSKDADNLPVSLTFVGADKPCRDANKLDPLGADAQWYSLENGREAEECTADERDPRYTQLSQI